jgi:hypothetical protein
LTDYLEQGPDFHCENHGTAFLLRPLTEAAQAWITEHLPDEPQWFDKGVVIEVSRIWPILADIQEAGLVVRPPSV